MAEPLKLLLEDDHPLVVAGVRDGREGDDAVESGGEARSGSVVIKLIERREPMHEVLSSILDVDFPLECARRRAMNPVAPR